MIGELTVALGQGEKSQLVSRAEIERLPKRGDGIRHAEHHAIGLAQLDPEGGVPWRSFEGQTVACNGFPGVAFLEHRSRLG